MIPRTRRQFLKIGLAGAGTLLLPGAGFLAGAETGDDAHFFLMIVLNGGADSSYLFDARPLSMTAAGRIQNYLGVAPRPCEGRNGVEALASVLTQPLLALRNYFSILNGVHMTPSFDGHLQNMNFLFSGNPFGGDSFIPHLNLADTGRKPEALDGILTTNPVIVNVDNHSGVVPLAPKSIETLATTLKKIEPLEAGDPLAEFMRTRVKASTQGPGRFSAAANLMLAGLDVSPQVHRKLAKLSAPRPDRNPEQQSIDLIGECFRLSISRSAIYVLSEYFDVHAADQAKAQPKLFRSAVDKVATLMRGLIETPFDAKRSLFDVTTVMVATEFGRTMRAPGRPIDDTGTNHNQFANSLLLGGKGIRPGFVVGASDLADASATVSKAHLAVDPLLEKAMGLPFDYATMRTRPDRPEAFDIQDYLTINAVVNTIYALFGVPKSHYRTQRRDLPVAPVLRGLLA